MHYLKQILARIRPLTSRTGPQRRPLSRLDRHGLNDLGLDPMAAEYLKDAALWRELAA